VVLIIPFKPAPVVPSANFPAPLAPLVPPYWPVQQLSPR
jgi:hypothetical protein